MKQKQPYIDQFQFLVDSSLAITLWLQVCPSRNSAQQGGPTFCSTLRQMSLGGQIFTHTFICA